jgi:hypothetical protein
MAVNAGKQYLLKPTIRILQKAVLGTQLAGTMTMARPILNRFNAVCSGIF